MTSAPFSATPLAVFPGQMIALPGLTLQVHGPLCQINSQSSWQLAVMSAQTALREITPPVYCSILAQTLGSSVCETAVEPFRPTFPATAKSAPLTALFIVPVGLLVDMRISAHDAYGLRKVDEDEDRDLQCKLWYTSDSFGQVGVTSIQPWIGELTPVSQKALAWPRPLARPP